MDQVIKAVAENVRSLRLARGLSLNELAAASKTGKATLSRIEAGDANPTVETLYALADALGVPFGSLTATTGPQVEHIRAQDLATVTGAVHAKVLTQATGARLVEALDIVFPAGQVRHANAHPKGVIEHILLTEGRLRAGPTGAEREMDAGDVLRFPGDVPHSYEALDDRPARAIALMAY
ncbi:helix-turn-helix domain-containing protein [Solirubrobacter soli]|uniref:helix-turn-helix domain-containing protein n=1 Tax=Solirubrobacter soli TaxID=363832 RepID=UPI00040BA6CD|nr:XRE family transcriptional regulator [Solirubrobacter soli]